MILYELEPYPPPPYYPHPPRPYWAPGYAGGIEGPGSSDPQDLLMLPLWGCWGVYLFVFSCFRVFVCLSRLSYTWSYVRVDFVLSANRISHVPQYSVGQNQESIVPYE